MLSSDLRPASAHAGLSLLIFSGQVRRHLFSTPNIWLDIMHRAHSRHHPQNRKGSSQMIQVRF